MAVVYTPEPLERSGRLYVAGHRGLVGSAVWRAFEAAGYRPFGEAGEFRVYRADREP